MATSAVPPDGGGVPNVAVPVPLPPVKLRPGRVWYWVALAVFFAAVAWAVAGFVVVIRQVDSFPRVPIPGRGIVFLHRGGYVVYYEMPAGSSAAPAFHLDMYPGPGALQTSLTHYSGSQTYQFGSRAGTAVFVVQIARPGRFLVHSTSSPAVPGSHLAFGPSIAGWIVGIVLPALFLALFAIGGAIAVAITRHVRARPARPPPVLS